MVSVLCYLIKMSAFSDKYWHRNGTWIGCKSKICIIIPLFKIYIIMKVPVCFVIVSATICS